MARVMSRTGYAVCPWFVFRLLLVLSVALGCAHGHAGECELMLPALEDGVDYCDGAVTVSAQTVDVDANHAFFLPDGVLRLQGDGHTPTSRAVLVDGAEVSTIVLDSVEIDTQDSWGAPLAIHNNHTELVLWLEGGNTLTAVGHFPALMYLALNQGALTITAEVDSGGSLTVNGGFHAAGMGGYGFVPYASSGIIRITGGTITAQGGWGASAIGSANGGSGRVIISGGEVHARGGDFASGIGGGHSGAGIVTVTGGRIFAAGGAGGSGIGGGWFGDGTVVVSGGEISAAAGSIEALSRDDEGLLQPHLMGSGIGGGAYGSGRITVSGGRVEAMGGWSGSGIGGGYAGNGIVAVEGGRITAYGGNKGSGIGGGFNGDGIVSLAGGMIESHGGAGASGIGGGACGEGGRFCGRTETVKLVAADAPDASEAVSGMPGAEMSAQGGKGVVTVHGGSIKAQGGKGASDLGCAADYAGVCPPVTDGRYDPSQVWLKALTPVVSGGMGQPVTVQSFPPSTLPDDYGLLDVTTDNSGKIYVYLPLL